MQERTSLDNGGHHLDEGTSLYQASRRRLLGWAGGAALAGAVLARGLTTLPAEAQEGQGIEGSWLVTVNIPGQPPGKELVTFTSDGNFITTGAPTEPGPPASGITRIYTSAGHGVWRKKPDSLPGERVFVVTFVRLAFDANGTFVGSDKVWANLSLNEPGDTFAGPFRFEARTSEGRLLFSGSGTAEGGRITLELM